MTLLLRLWPLGAVLALGLCVAGAVSYWKHAIGTAQATGYAAATKDAQDAITAVQAEAEAAALRGVIDTMEQQQAIAQETVHAFANTVDDIDARARAISVQHDATLARLAASRVDLPAPGTAPGEPEAAPAGDGLPWGVAFPLMVQAAKDQAQLNAILDFEEAQDALAATPAP